MTLDSSIYVCYEVNLKTRSCKINTYTLQNDFRTFTYHEHNNRQQHYLLYDHMHN